MTGAAMVYAQGERENEPAEPRSPVPIERDVVASGLKRPWGLAFMPGGGFLVTEKQGGLIRIQANGQRTSVSGLPNDIDIERRERGDNSGLFDVVLHPKFRRNGVLFISYAAKGPGGTATKLIRAVLEGNGLRHVQTLLEAGPRREGRFHYGGGLLIGPDEKLYLSVGERHYAESENPPLPVAQDITDRRGKIYRLNLDGSIPRNNPPLGAGAVPGVYAMGIRATQGFALQPSGRRIWFSEHGTIGGDEVNILRPGANYGWPNRTSGGYRSQGYAPPSRPGVTFTDPQHVWTGRTVAPTGLTFYSGTAFPEWRGDLLVAGLRRGYLMRLDVEGEDVRGVEYLLEDAPVRLRNVKQSPDGQLYVLTDEDDGKLIRLVRGGDGPPRAMEARNKTL
jgi:glucose/arabinose dehydrogenase